MAERRQKQLSPEKIAEVKLKKIDFREEDDEEVRRVTLLAMAGIINKRYSETLEPQENTPVIQEAAVGAESVAESQESIEAALVRYEGQYDTLPGEVKSRCTWEELSSRLNAKDGHYLKLAMDMQDKGKLVFIDKDGNPVFRDGGVEPVMKGMNYNDAREALYGKDYEEGTPHFGYEMPNSVDGIRAIEKFTKKPFVASDNGKEWRSTWMESKKNPSFARAAYFAPNDGLVGVYGDNNPRNGGPNRGVVRLLRVKKMA